MDGGRNHHEGVLNVEHVRPVLAKQFCNVSMRIRRPHGMLRELQATCSGVLFRIPVITPIDDDFVPGGLQKGPLLLKDDVFTARLLVGCVDEQDFHRSRDRRTLGSAGVAAWIHRADKNKVKQAERSLGGCKKYLSPGVLV